MSVESRLHEHTKCNPGDSRPVITPPKNQQNIRVIRCILKVAEVFTHRHEFSHLFCDNLTEVSVDCNFNFIRAKHGQC